jgi:cell wall assembly regulator SMI1/ankyrin repeat protein
MSTAAEMQKSYYELSEQETIDLMRSDAFVATEWNGIFSYHAYNNRVEVIKAFLSKSKPEQAELDICFGSIWLISEMLDLLLPLHPSPAAMGNAVYSICADIIQNRSANTAENHVQKIQVVERLLQAGATVQEHQNYEGAAATLQCHRADLFQKYFDTPEAQRWFLQFCCRAGNESLKAILLSRPINYEQADGIALLLGAMDDDKPLFYKTLPLVKDVNYAIDPYQSLLDFAIHSDDLAIVKSIIERGGKPNYNGKNILLQSVNSRDAQLPQLLLDTFDLDTQMNDNECLVNACQFQKVDIARLLLERGADVHGQRNACLKIAVKNQHHELIALLKSFGANDLDIAPYQFNCDVATADFETLWKEWLIYYQKYFPSATKPVLDYPEYRAILTPAPVEDIAACEEKINLKFSAELKTIYKHCTQGGYLFFGMFLLNPTAIAQICQDWIDIGFIGLPENDQTNYPMHPQDSIQPHYINAKWLSFANDLTNNHVSIDYNPAENGKMGQLINSGRDQWERFVIADSITELARKVMRRVESNQVEITAEGYFLLKETGGGGFLYDVLDLIKTQQW